MPQIFEKICTNASRYGTLYVYNEKGGEDMAVGFPLYIDLKDNNCTVFGGGMTAYKAVVTLLRYVRKGYLYIFGGALILGGGITVLIEFLINVTFGIHEALFWSLYPLAAGVILGLMLLVIAICKPLRRSLHRKFFF